MTAPLDITREAILSFRWRSLALNERLRPNETSLRRAAWAGLQDGMPQAGLLSLHARVERTGPRVLEDDSLVQLWGPRYQVYIVARRDLAYFSLGRFPDTAARRRRATDLAARLHDVLGEDEMPYGKAAKIMGVLHNELRYAAVTGTILIGWDGAGQPTIRRVAPPAVNPPEARLELARRYLRAFGPANPEAFQAWAGIARKEALAAFGALGPSLTPVRTPIGDGGS